MTNDKQEIKYNYTLTIINHHIIMYPFSFLVVIVYLFKQKKLLFYISLISKHTQKQLQFVNLMLKTHSIHSSASSTGPNFFSAFIIAFLCPSFLMPISLKSSESHSSNSSILRQSCCHINTKYC